MYSTKEELINFKHSRDLKTGEFEVEILLKSKAEGTEQVINFGVPYVAIPLHFDYAYIFRLDENILYFFKVKKDSLETYSFEKIEFNVIFEDKKRIKQLRRMLDRAEVRPARQFYEELMLRIEPDASNLRYISEGEN